MAVASLILTQCALSFLTFIIVGLIFLINHFLQDLDRFRDIIHECEQTIVAPSLNEPKTETILHKMFRVRPNFYMVCCGIVVIFLVVIIILVWITWLILFTPEIYACWWVPIPIHFFITWYFYKYLDYIHHTFELYRRILQYLRKKNAQILGYDHRQLRFGVFQFAHLSVWKTFWPFIHWWGVISISLIAWAIRHPVFGWMGLYSLILATNFPAGAISQFYIRQWRERKEDCSSCLYFIELGAFIFISELIAGFGIAIMFYWNGPCRWADVLLIRFQWHHPIDPIIIVLIGVGVFAFIILVFNILTCRFFCQRRKNEIIRDAVLAQLESHKTTPEEIAENLGNNYNRVEEIHLRRLRPETEEFEKKTKYIEKLQRQLHKMKIWDKSKKIKYIKITLNYFCFTKESLSYKNGKFIYSRAPKAEVQK